MNLCSICSHVVAGQVFTVRGSETAAGELDVTALILVLGVEHDEDPEPPRRDDEVHYVWVTLEPNGDETFGSRDLVTFNEDFEVVK